MRIGIGIDVHPFAEGRKLVIGGVDIPSARGLEGHSDADVLLHAVSDALLGAAALGDIGLHFPNTSAEFKDIDSMILLRHVGKLLQKEGFAAVNVDAMLLLEAPKIAPYIEEMRRNIAGCLGMEISAVSVKATTNEKLGYIGREEGAAAHAVCIIRQY
ncbi:MAG: 2-C-methyl-D-erythritol 2,4-cyclodiphosphate synthase [Chlorobi bacterium]|nr:2-C-methyl-D-erythritol 2,4-cyclodiphosphate synthase [Chlorobiota bacterium]